jgi:MFS family permease
MEDYDNKKDRNVVLISAFISFALNSTVRFFIPVLLPFLIVSLNINLYLGSLLITSYWIGYTLFQIPSGIIADRFGTAKVNKISFIALTIAFTFLFFVRTDFSALIAVQVFLGIFSAFIYITDASLVQKWTPLKRRASFVGLYQTGFFVGASLGEFFILETFKLSFIVPFSITLTFLFMACILNIFFIKDPNVKKIKERGKLSRNIIYVCFIRFSAGFSYIGFLSLFTSFIIFDHITSFSNAYSLAWIPAVGGLLGSPLGGYLSMKHNRGKAILSIFPTILMGLSLIVLPQVSFVYVT